MCLDGPKFCYTLVFTVVGTLWSLVFSRCSVYLLNLYFATATPCGRLGTSTTFAITVVATTAATLTPILNRILKPLFKQAIGKVKKAIGKKGTKFSGKKPMKSKINKV